MDILGMLTCEGVFVEVLDMGCQIRAKWGLWIAY
jgi:hypothetical protein